MPRGTSEVVLIAAGVLAVFIVVALGESWSPNAWAALGTWTTAGIAAAAGLIALGQLGEARNLRREQAQPYVMAFIEESAPATQYWDLVIKNYGATAAYDVRLHIDPAPRRSLDKNKTPEQIATEIPWLPSHWPTLVPGQEFRTLWDSFERNDTDLPDRHEATIAFRDSGGDLHTLTTVLDWTIIKQRHVFIVYGTHHAANALRDISTAVKSWRDPGGRGMTVWTRDGDRRDQQKRVAMESSHPARETQQEVEDGQ